MEQSKLFCKGGGCTAKLGAGVLSRVLERLPKFPADPNLLIGFDSKDDAAVLAYRRCSGGANPGLFSAHGG